MRDTFFSICIGHLLVYLRTLVMMQQVSHAHDPEWERNFPLAWPAWARLELQDGRTVATTGSPEN